MSKIRHWKQRWSPTAPLIFAKKLKIGDGHVLPGDRVTDQHRKDLGLHRLRRWWEAGVLALAEYPKITDMGGGWHEVLLGPDQEPKKVRGQKALEELIG